MNDTAQINDTIVCEIDIAAPRERVFDAWTDPQQRLAWWGDASTYRCTRMDSDLRVGGAWRTEGTSADGKPFAVSGRYTRVERPTALGFTWNHDWGKSQHPETHVLIELTATSSGTHLTLTHSGFVNAPERDSHNQGWQRVLGWLESYLSKR